MNNYTSDYRAAEASWILAIGTPSESAAQKERQNLLPYINRAIGGYGSVFHEPAEQVIFRKFVTQWNAYLKIVDAYPQATRQVSKKQLTLEYLSASKHAYDTASDTLGALTALSVERARASSLDADTAYANSVWVTCFTIALGGLMAWLASHYIRLTISRPLRSITDAMQQLARNPADCAIPGTARADEIGDMARMVAVFQNNALELAESRKQLAAHADQLGEELEREQQLTAMQRNFVMMASHEFRTPLGIIDGHAQRLIKLRESLAPADIVERAGRVRRAVLQMTSVIDNLLHSERLAEGRSVAKIRYDRVDLTNVAINAVQFYREISPGANLIEDIAKVPEIYGDEKMLFQAFLNLLSNAVKYSEPGDPVHVSLGLDTAGRLAFTVKDQGIGIDPVDIPRMFQRYTRGKNAVDIPGTGLGLFLVRTVANLHNGGAQVTSELGAGSEFTILLPAPDQPAISRRKAV